MASRLEQIYVQTESTESIKAALQQNRSFARFVFHKHPKYRLDGVRQVLNYAARKNKRTFELCPPKDGWVCMWEVIDYGAFVDPWAVCILSDEVGTSALWVRLNDDYNIWTYQIYARGKLQDELFRPEDYFMGKGEKGNLRSYGRCWDFADEFNRKMQLPYFLTPIRTLRERLSPKKVIVRGPGMTK